MKLLNQNINPSLYQVILTIDGSEDKYAKDILNAYGNLENIDFVVCCHWMKFMIIIKNQAV